MESCKQFLNGNNGGILILDRAGRIIFVNKITLEILDQEEKEVAGQNFFEVLSRKFKTLFISNIVPLVPVGFLVYCGAAPKAYNNSQALIVHQLKTPLAAIKWSIEDLLGVNGLNEHQREALQEIYKTNEFGINLVNDLLDVAKFESGAFKVNGEPTDVAKLIEKIIGMLKIAANQKNQRIVFSSQFVPLRYVDPSLFSRAFQGLLENAIDYAPENTQISVKLFCEEKTCTVSVHNEGSVIAEEDRPKLFEKFYRGEAARKLKPSGTGLGLYIAKLAAEANGGKIWFESSAGFGTAFYLSIIDFRNQ